MPNNIPSNKWSKYILAAKVFRYIFGLALVLFILIGVPVISHQSPVLMFMFMITFPPALFIDPVIAAGIYFMISGKFRPRIDITVLIFSSAAIAGLIMLMQTSQQ